MNRRKLTVKRGDSSPSMRVVLVDTFYDPPRRIDLTAVDSVTAVMKRTAGTVRRPASTVDALGAAEFYWSAGDTDTVEKFLVEFEVVKDGRLQTFPTTGALQVEIVADL